MTIQTINIGTVPNDGTGDSARTSFDKLNQNFTDPANAASKLVGTGAAQVPTNNDLPAFGTAAEANIGTGPTEVPTNNDLGTAAQADVQTSPTDTTAGRVVTTDALSDNGGPIWTVASYQPYATLGLNALTRMYNASGGTIADQSTVSGTLLQKTYTDLSGNVVGSVVAAGIYRYVGGGTLPIDGIGDFSRES